MDYVKRVRAARGALNLSLDKFAQQIGMGRSTLVRIENGTREPTIDEYQSMADVSGFPLRFFTIEDLNEVLEGEPLGRDQYAEVLIRMEKMQHDFDARLEALGKVAGQDLVTKVADSAGVTPPNDRTPQTGRQPR